MPDKSEFLYPHSSYRGHFTPEQMMFNTNLQEFAQKVTYICNLETNGKLPPDTAYKEIKSLWKQLKRSKKELNIGDEAT
jgi:organic radical activating enzyme